MKNAILPGLQAWSFCWANPQRKCQHIHFHSNADFVLLADFVMLTKTCRERETIVNARDQKTEQESEGKDVMRAVQTDKSLSHMQVKGLIGDSLLVNINDRGLISDVLLISTAQFVPCRLMESDRVKWYKSREVGLLGLCCRYCDANQDVAAISLFWMRVFIATLLQSLFAYIWQDIVVDAHLIFETL